MKERLFYHGNRGFGDCFVLAAAASIYARQTGTPTVISYWGAFKGLAEYFDGVRFVVPEEGDEYRLSSAQRETSEVIDTGLEPYDYSKFNAVSWQLRAMTGLEIAFDTDMRMNISPLPSREFVSIVPSGNINGSMGVRNMELLLRRARLFYPALEFQVIGHPYSLSPYLALFDRFNVKDRRTEDRTCHVIMEQLRRSALLIAPHTGPIFPALAMGLRVWCEQSKRLDHDYLCDFPANRPMWIRR